MSNSDRLRKKIGLVRPALAAAGGRIWSPSTAADQYSEYLITIHGMVRASVPLMEAALERSRQIAAEDPVAAGMEDYFSHHIPEERGHDEWILEDLEILNVSRGDVLKRMPLPSIVRAVGAQYYWIHHVHPVALLGYIAVLEGHPPTVESIDQLVAATQLPKRAFRTLYKHAHLDVHHSDDLDEFLDSLPLDSWHDSLMGTSAFHTVGQLTRALEKVGRSENGAPCA